LIDCLSKESYKSLYRENAPLALPLVQETENTIPGTENMVPGNKVVSPKESLENRKKTQSRKHGNTSNKV
jgi:hypothetical protein